MKKRIATLALVLVVLFSSTSLVLGKSIGQTIVAWFYDIKVNVDGRTLHFSRSPFIYNDHTYVSLENMADQLGFDRRWNDKTKTMTLTSSENSGITLSTLKYDLDRKSKEVNDLKYQLQLKELELSMYREGTSSDNRSPISTLDRVEEILEDDFDQYQDDDVDMEFEYRLTQSSSGDVRVRMEVDFYRSSKNWRDRDRTDFREFILEICEEIEKHINENINVYIYDKESNRAASYEYDSDRNKIVDYTEH
jgi:hypothetical protein